MSRLRALLPLLLSLALGLPAAAADAPSAADTRAAIREMRTSTLKALYTLEPKAKTLVRGSAGYAVFSSTGVHVLFLGGAGGRGVVHDNLTGKDTYMRSASVGVGLGVGFKDMSLVLVFRKRDTLKQFIDQGWTFGGNATATAQAGGVGGNVTDVESRDGILIYPLSKDGLMAKGAVEGTKYWVDPDL